MSPLLSLFLAALTLTFGAKLQDRVEPPSFTAVTYVEVLASAPGRAAAVAAFKGYQAANRTQAGFVRVEAFEQSGRPGHFVVIETWRDQEAFDKRGAEIQKQLVDGLQPIRVSDVDRRPYKPLTIGPSARTTRDTVYVITHVDASPPTQVPMMLQRLAEDSRRDEGNLRFDVVQHTMRANHFTVIEAWRDRRALDAHAAAAHTKQYRDEYGPRAGSPLDERVFEGIEL